MRATSLEAETGFDAIAEEVARLSASLDRLHAARPAPGSRGAWEAGHICASATEKIYTGFERVMARIVARTDLTEVGHAEGWHRSLLRRVARPMPGRRPAVISQACYDRLDRLRAFRHRERNTYGLDLDLDIVLERSAEAFDVFRTEVGLFFDPETSKPNPPPGAGLP